MVEVETEAGTAIETTRIVTETVIERRRRTATRRMKFA
jgi:hypothetical protein